MDLKQNISSLKSSAERQLHALNSKEKTKNALLLPFFNALGYNPFDVADVEPAFPVQMQGTGSRDVDYALKVDGSPAILVECAKAETDLDSIQGEPIARWLPHVDANIVAETNGLTYRMYADLPGQAGAQVRPFLEFDLLEHTAEDIVELQPLTQSAFDAEAVLASAFQREYSRRLEGYLAQQREAPDEHFVRFLAAQVFEGEVSKEALDQFRPVVRDVLQQIVTGEIETREDVVAEADDAMSNSGMPEILEGFNSASRGDGDGASGTEEPWPTEPAAGTGSSSEETSSSSQPTQDRQQNDTGGPDVDVGSPGPSSTPPQNQMGGQSNIATEFAEKVLGRKRN